MECKLKHFEGSTEEAPVHSKTKKNVDPTPGLFAFINAAVIRDLTLQSFVLLWFLKML